MDPYERLAEAIALQAAEDYRAALGRLRRRPSDGGAMDMAMGCERFFRSQWFEALSGADGEYVINRLREEARKK